jgi:hypothetical protein
MNNRSFRLTPRRASAQHQQQVQRTSPRRTSQQQQQVPLPPLLSQQAEQSYHSKSATNKSVTKTGFRLSPRRASAQHQQQVQRMSPRSASQHQQVHGTSAASPNYALLTDPVPLPPLFSQQAEQSYHSKSATTKTFTKTSHRLLSRMFLRGRNTNKNSTTISTTHSPIKSKATAGLPPRSITTTSINSSSNKTTKLDLSRDATRVLRRSQQMRRQKSEPDLVGSVLVVPKKTSKNVDNTVFHSTTATGNLQHDDPNDNDSNNNNSNKDELTTKISTPQFAESPRRASCDGIGTATSHVESFSRQLQLQQTKSQPLWRSIRTPLSPSSVTETTVMTEATDTLTLEKTTLARNDSYRFHALLICKPDDDDGDDKNLNETTPPQSPLSPKNTMSPSHDCVVDNLSSTQMAPSALAETSSASYQSVTIESASMIWAPCIFCKATMYCVAVDLVLCPSCHCLSPVVQSNNISLGENADGCGGSGSDVALGGLHAQEYRA